MGIGTCALYIKVVDVVECFYTCVPMACLDFTCSNYPECKLSETAWAQSHGMRPFCIEAGNQYGKSLRKLRERVVDEQADLMVCSSIRVWSWTRVEVAMFLALVNQL